MLDTTTTRFSHIKPADTAWRSDGLRDFYLYKDLGLTTPPLAGQSRTWSRPMPHQTKAPAGTTAAHSTVSGLAMMVWQ